MKIETIITFTVFNKVLKKHILQERLLTQSECEIIVSKIYDSAILHEIEYRESKYLDTIKVKPIPTYQIIHEYDLDQKGYT